MQREAPVGRPGLRRGGRDLAAPDEGASEMVGWGDVAARLAPVTLADGEVPHVGLQR